jgi:SAM-dependent methyltransferase
MTTAEFYDQLAPLYHLIYPDWEASIRRQATALDSVIREFWGKDHRTILDVACGIGTQALGLAQLGYDVTASDLAPAEIERAKHEAAQRSLPIAFSVADMREVHHHHLRQFDVVVACDNAIPHLLSDDALLAAFQAFFQCVRPGGGCLISVRDYDKEERSGLQVKAYGVRLEGSIRYLLFQVWEFHGLIYDLALYYVEDRGDANPATRVMRSQYYAVSIDKLMTLLRDAGFQKVQRLDDRFFQPLIIGTKE